jgi:hypothetical protein
VIALQTSTQRRGASFGALGDDGELLPGQLNQLQGAKLSTLFVAATGTASATTMPDRSV